MLCLWVDIARVLILAGRCPWCCFCCRRFSWERLPDVACFGMFGWCACSVPCLLSCLFAGLLLEILLFGLMRGCFYFALHEGCSCFVS